MFDVISIGDSTVDEFLALDEAQVLCDLNREDCIICLHYADKIPVADFKMVPAAGNAANFAVGTARLGLKAGIYTILGDDRPGQAIFEVFKKEGVAQDFITFDKKHGTNHSVVLNYLGERTILVFHNPRDYDFPENLGPTRWIYYTSVGKDHQALHQPLIDFIKKNGVKLAFNPGSWQLKEGINVLSQIIKFCQAFIVNKEEAERLVGEGDIPKLLKELAKFGSKIVVITDGPNGSYTFDGQKFYKLGIFECPIVERTGAGDAYSTGLITAQILGKSLPEAMAWGTVNAASVIQKIGPQAGLLTRTEMEKLLTENPNFKADEF